MSMVIGVGIDLIEIERVKQACEKEAFFTRCFDVREQEFLKAAYEKSSQRAAGQAAGNYAVKEAVAKAMGTGVRGFALSEIIVLRNEAGAPYVELTGKAQEVAQSLGICRWHVSISNTRNQATAIAVAEGSAAE